MLEKRFNILRTLFVKLLIKTKMVDSKTVSINEFKWKQMFNDSKGKTSLSAFTGFVIVLVGCGGFVSSGMTVLIMVALKLEKDQGVLNFLNSLCMQSVGVIVTGAGIVAANRVSKDKEVADEAKQ